MFSRLVHSARTVLSRSPSATDTPSSDQADIDSQLEADMVTTRKGTTVEGSTPVSRKTKRGFEDATPVSSVKRRKNASQETQEEEETPKNLPHRGRRRASPKVIVERDNEPLPNTPKAAIEFSAEDIIPPSTQDTVYHTPDTVRTTSIYATPATQKAKGRSPTSKGKGSANKKGNKNIKRPSSSGEEPQPTPTVKDEAAVAETSLPTARLLEEIPSSTFDSEQQPISSPEPEHAPLMAEGGVGITEHALPAKGLRAEIPSSTFDSDQQPISSSEAELERDSKAQLRIEYTKQPVETQKAHIRFGSEDPSPILVEERTAEVLPEAGEGSDSEEAPEEVTKSVAITQSKAATAHAARAYKDLEAKEKARRQERALQAEEEAQRRKKREERKERKHRKALQLAGIALDDDDEDGDDTGPGTDGVELDIHNLPALLPDSLLESAGDRRPPTPPRVLGVSDAALALAKKEQKLKRHIKFLERGERPAKDVQRGSVKVHVLGKENPLLAPKVNRNTKNVREHWLKGRERMDMKRGKVDPRRMERRDRPGGFLRGGED